MSKTDKGGVKKGDLFNGVFGLGEMTEGRQNFTSQVIVETVGADAKVVLTPMASGRFTGKNSKGEDTAADVKIVKKADGTTIYATVKVAEGAATYTDVATDGAYTLVEGDKVAYFSEEFQMEHVPAQDIPTIGPRMNRIALVAEPRRIAVRYDQITAFQA